MHGFLFYSQIYSHICVHWFFTSYLPRCFGLFKRFLIFGFGEPVLSGFSFFSFSFSSPIYRHGSEPLRALSTERKWADTTLVFCLVFFDRLFAAFEQQHVAMEREKDWNRRPQIQLLSDLDSMHPNIHLPNRFSLLNRHHLYAL